MIHPGRELKIIPRMIASFIFQAGILWYDADGNRRIDSTMEGIFFNDLPQA